MRQKGVILEGAIALLIALLPVTAFAFGIGVEIPFYTLDLTTTLAQVTVAAEGALGALGVPPAEAAEVLNEIDMEVSALPLLFPVPLLGGSIEFSLPFVLIDGLRLSGGFLNDALLRGLADLFDLMVPQPLLHEQFEADGFEATVTADVSFFTFMLSTDLVKRLDLLIAGIDIGLGLDLIQGRITPEVALDVPGFETEVDAALAALHLGELYWSAFAAHGTFGFEIGLPFLRTFVEVRYLLPISRTPGWWGLDIGGFTGSVGLVIRF
ncbi:TPA: hypothetical protein DIT45_00460 [Candidatus Acetothermia bacterium]|nr:hypothetical protein [Candidatus Acetothermia bacterium]